MKRYACGFMFNEAKTHVLLITKCKPSWQAGKLNGIGGKVEHGETFLDAMVREFEEETGIHHAQWECFVRLRNENVAYELDFFRAFGPIEDAKQMEEEKPVIAPVYTMTTAPVIPNLRWLVPLALEMDLRTPIPLLDTGKN